MYVIKFKYSSGLKENTKKILDFLSKFIEACLFYTLVVLHLTSTSSCCGSTVPVHKKISDYMIFA